MPCQVDAKGVVWASSVLFGTAFGQAGRLAHAVAEVEELGATDLAMPQHFELGDLGGVDGEGAFNPFTGHNAADGEHLAGAGTPTGDDDAAEDLDPFLVTLFEDAGVTLTESPISNVSGFSRRLEASTFFSSST